MSESGILNRPGSGWDRLAAAVAGAVPASEIEAVWLFRTLRREGTEWGTALVARVDGEERERRRIYTARFQHVLKGKERGKFEWALEEVGSGPVDTIGEIIAGVRKRMDDDDPRPVTPADWLPPVDAAPREG
ncbi:MAG TPA: hypothetical protein VL853_04865 [Gemmatimonadales bacterium]|jgi:hypothetical protein|nr:hypothetical protein [Gemmatimonadales bacterium]